MTDHFQSVTMMIEDLRSDDPEQRLHSVKGLHLIAQTLGTERTKTELLPFLTDYLDDNDTVLHALANALGTMIAEVGGVQHVNALLTPLELLSTLDEVTIRDETVRSLDNLAETLYKHDSDASGQRDYLALIARLSKAESPQSRYCACSIIGVPYKYGNESTKTQLRQTFQRLCSDDEVMVRRAACIALGKMAELLRGACGDFMNNFSSFCQDSNDSVRLQAVPTAVGLVPNLTDNGISQMVTLAKTLSGDRSWRVRYMFADKMGDLVSRFSANDVQKVFVPVFRSLCSDNEPEIRASTVFNLEKVLKAVAEGGKRDLVSAACELRVDQNPHVRVSLAATILKASAHVTKEVWSATLFPVCNELLQDAEPDVRLSVVSGFSAVAGSSASAVAPKVVPVVLALAEDPKWRIRETVVNQIPSICNNLGKSADSMLDLCAKLLTDRVSSIRMAAGVACGKIVEQSGMEYAVSRFFPKLKPLADSTNYLHRVTYTQTLKAVSFALDAPTFESQVVPQLVTLSSDKVGNVRIAVATAINEIRQNSPAGVDVARMSQIMAITKRLEDDVDKDVSQAMTRIPMKL